MARRKRSSGLEDLLILPFRNQVAAIVIALAGLFLISDMPMSVITSFAPTNPIDVTDPNTISAQAISRGSLGGLMILVPMARVFGLMLMIASGIALIKERRRWGYSTMIKDPTVAAGLGGITIGIVVWSVMTQGLWTAQAMKAADASTRIATGQPIRPTAMPNTQTSTVPGSPMATRGDTATTSLTPNLQPGATLTQDRPFPANGTFERTLPLQGKIAKMTFANRSQNNAIVVWFYNLNQGKGEQEALRLYVTAGQSTTVDIPAFDYRMGIYEAPTSYGLDRGFGPDAKMKDLGLIDLKTPASSLSQQPTGLYYGYGGYVLKPGILLRTR